MNIDINLEKINKDIENKSTNEIICYFINNFEKVALSSSLAAEDQVLTDMILKEDINTSIFTLDTGRLHNETYNVMDETNLKYGIKIDVYFPKNDDIEMLYKKQGINGHYESIENRKYCCNVRKMEPLKRALKNVNVWITGLRATQSITRADLPFVQWDNNFNVLKVNPLINWQENDVWDYIKRNKVPYNKLHKLGYPSIGCAPCTRAIQIGEDIRAGRWWWENPENKECGLHIN